MEDVVQLHAEVPRQLKRRVFAELAWQERPFKDWIKEQMERWLAEQCDAAESAAAEKEEARSGLCPQPR